MNKEKLIKTISIEDKGQDFTELDIYDNGVIRGYSIMFSKDRLSLLGIGTNNGKVYYTFEELKEKKFKQKLKGLTIYLKDTGRAEPLPWKASTLNYKVI